MFILIGNGNTVTVVELLYLSPTNTILTGDFYLVPNLFIKIEYTNREINPVSAWAIVSFASTPLQFAVFSECLQILQAFPRYATLVIA